MQREGAKGVIPFGGEEREKEQGTAPNLAESQGPGRADRTHKPSRPRSHPRIYHKYRVCAQKEYTEVTKGEGRGRITRVWRESEARERERERESSEARI